MLRKFFPVVAVGAVAAVLVASLMLNAEDKPAAGHDHADHAGHDHADHDHAGHDHAAVSDAPPAAPAVTYPEGFEEETARVSYAIGVK